MGYTIVGWIGGILQFLTIVWIIVGNAMHFVYWLKRLNVKKKCNNQSCRRKHFCVKHDNTRELFSFRIHLLRKQIIERQSAIDAVVGNGLASKQFQMDNRPL